MTECPPEQESGGSGDEDKSPEQPNEQSTEELFAEEAELDDGPELEPEFKEALREAAPVEPPAEERQPPNEQATETKPVRKVVIGAGPEPPPPAVPPPAVPPPATPPPGVTPVPAPPTGAEPEPRRPRLWLRFLLGAFLVVASCASATTAAGLLRISDFVHDIQPIPDIADRLAEVDGGEPQTFLILGSDRRAATAGDSPGLSDTTILLRIDPHQNVIAVLNIPRDLRVFIPGIGINKFNAAYAYGGPKLALRTVQRLMAGMGLRINHLVNVDFLGFVRAINAIECVYVDVDRRYYHSNVGLASSQQYDEIDVYPGYQKLCGLDALDYVRYRHTDTDLVRAARQQDFLRLARQRVPASKLFTDRDQLMSIFTTHTSSDINSLDAMLDVIKLMIEARSAPIREVHFPARLGPSYVYSSRSAIKGAIAKFLGFEATGGPRGVLEQSDTEPAAPRKRERRNPKPEIPQSDGLVDASLGSRDVAEAALKRSRFRVFYPTRLPSGTIYVSNIDVGNPRVYRIRDTDGDPHQAYKFVMEFSAGGLPEYFGLEGIQGWSDPPILNDPSETREIRGRDYDIYLSGDRVRVVAWEVGENSYWVSNSLLQTLTNDQMLGVARTASSLTPTLPPRRKR